MASKIYYSPFIPTFNGNGLPVANARLYFFYSETTDLAPIFQDAAMTIPMANPVISDGAARYPNIYMNEAVIFCVRETGKDGVPLADDIDPYVPGQAAVVVPDLPEFAAPDGASLVGFLPLGAGAVATTAQEKLRESVSVEDFGAACDGVTNDSAAMVLAVTYCAANNWPTLLIPGPCLLSSAVNIDRAVDTMTGEWIIRGQGPDAGFVVSTAINMFDSTLALIAGIGPSSEKIRFQNIQFSTTNGALAAYAFTQKFLRMVLDGCYFDKMKCLNAATYAQEWVFCGGTQAIQWQGDFFTSGGGFNIVSERSCKYEQGTGYAFVMYSATKGVLGCSLFGLCEGVAGFIKAGACSALRAGGYFEGNTSPTFDFTLAANTGIELHIENIVSSGTLAPPVGNIADPNFYEVKCGATATFVSTCLFANGRLYDDSAMTFGALRHLGGVPALALNKTGFPITVLGFGMLDIQTNVTALAGGGQAGATPITKPFAVINTVASANDSVIMPLAKAGMVYEIVNFGANNAKVFPAVGQQINSAGANVGWTHNVGIRQSYWCQVDGNWLPLSAN